MLSNFIKNSGERIRNEGLAEAFEICAKIFNCYKLYVENQVNYHLARINIYNYVLAREQMEIMQTITFGDKINVLLMTDHLYGYALGLEDYLRNSIDITAELAIAPEEAQSIINQKHIDFLILVGLFKNPNYYKIIQAVKKSNELASVIMYESADRTVEEICKEYSIEYTYNIIYSLEGLVAYMRKCYVNDSVDLY